MTLSGIFKLWGRINNMMHKTEEVVCNSAVIPSSNQLYLPVPGGVYTHFLKRVSDIFLSSLALLFCLPLFAVVALWVIADSRGPVFFIQNRFGKDGKIFRILKFRTMYEELDADGVRHITKVGKILRDSKVDELPQIFNIIRGDMSIIGPRPLSVDETEQICKQDGIPHHQPGFLHLVKPGLIGLEQMNRVRHLTYSERFNLNFEYERSIGWLLDSKIFLTSLIQCRLVCTLAVASAVIECLWLIK